MRLKQCNDSEKNILSGYWERSIFNVNIDIFDHDLKSSTEIFFRNIELVALVPPRKKNAIL